MKHRFKTVITTMLVFLLMITGSVFAFNDIDHSPNKDKIMQLRALGAVHGVNEEQFMPETEMTVAQAVSMLVSSFKLNIDHIQFVKEPMASDSFNHVPEDAWYTDAFIIAKLNGLPLDRDIRPQDKITREQFAHLLLHALTAKGEYAFTEMYFMLEDESEVDEAYMGSIQMLLNGKIITLDENNKFYPKRVITRGEAAGMIFDALEFVKRMNEPIPDVPNGDDPVSSDPVPPVLDEPVQIDDEPELKTVMLQDEIQQVIVTWGAKPNSGYDIRIEKIEFKEQGEAHIYVRRIQPQEGHMYLQVITHPEDRAYLSKEWKPVLKLIEDEPIQ
ncbi:S-layer homology domain-containing protein [Marinicrinis lubricantis]|uniref:S-layer homology domain-containing protein n=1 Tax=Marinicrinis lubricantis TaxID=2086470 RepID=A0ABW1IT31_9BACL